MALKPFSIYGTFSGRTTPVAGGPKISKDHSHMDISIHQCDRGDMVEIVTVESRQTKRTLTTTITIRNKEGEEKTHTIKTRL